YSTRRQTLPAGERPRPARPGRRGLPGPSRGEDGLFPRVPLAAAPWPTLPPRVAARAGRRVRLHPLKKVTITDRTPRDSSFGELAAAWQGRPTLTGGNTLRLWLAARLPRPAAFIGTAGREDLVGWYVYDSHEGALRAISAGCLSWARRSKE